MFVGELEHPANKICISLRKHFISFVDPVAKL